MLLQHTATHCVLQHAASHCNTLQRTAARCITLQHTATHTCYASQSNAKLRFRSILLQHTVTRCNTLHHTATHCNTLQHIPVLDPGPMQITIRIDLFTTHCNTLQHTATHCNTLQHTATHTCNGSWSHAKSRFGSMSFSVRVFFAYPWYSIIEKVNSMLNLALGKITIQIHLILSARACFSHTPGIVS